MSEYLNSIGIKTGTYSSKMSERAKSLVHERWREGTLRVICATIGMYSQFECIMGANQPHKSAFGLGIDKGDVRFVIHQSVSGSSLALYLPLLTDNVQISVCSLRPIVVMILNSFRNLSRHTTKNLDAQDVMDTMQTVFYSIAHKMDM